MKKYIILILVALLVVGCDGKLFATQDAATEEIPKQEEIIPPEDIAVVEDTTETLEINLSCTINSDCEQGKSCINKICGKVADLYNTACESKCNFNQIEISTSDGDDFNLSRGQGSYTAAGAVEWKLLSGPDYCPGNEIIVPVELIRKDTGKIIGKEVITLNPGKTSDSITHPSIKSISFTLKIEKVNEEC